MARLAGLTGVSRQTVYNEIGGKADLADAMVQAELAHFLEGVTTAFDAHPDDVVAAVEQAVATTLTAAATNPLLQAIVSATHGLDTELLPLVTTRAATLLGRATAVVTELSGAAGANVLATAARASVNVRLLPGDTVASAYRRIEKVVADDDIEIAVISASEA